MHTLKNIFVNGPIAASFIGERIQKRYEGVLLRSTQVDITFCQVGGNGKRDGLVAVTEQRVARTMQAIYTIYNARAAT